MNRLNGNLIAQISTKRHEEMTVKVESPESCIALSLAGSNERDLQVDLILKTVNLLAWFPC